MRPIIFLLLTFLFNLLPAQNPHSPSKIVLKTYELDSLKQHPLILAQQEKDFTLIMEAMNAYIKKRYSYSEHRVYTCNPELIPPEKIKANERELKELEDRVVKRLQVFEKGYNELVMKYVFPDTSHIEISTLLYHNKTQVAVQNHTNLLAENFIKRIRTKSGHKEWIEEMKKLYLVFLGLDKVKWIKD